MEFLPGWVLTEGGSEVVMEISCPRKGLWVADGVPDGVGEVGWHA